MRIAKKLTPAQRREASSYFRGVRDVVKGGRQEDPVEAEFHHIDDREESFGVDVNAVWNLIPLSHGRNIGVEDIRQGRDDPELLSPDYLWKRANTHFARKDVSAAYGCARLAATIGRRYYPSKLRPWQYLPHAAQAFYYARHNYNPGVLLDILNREILPALGKTSLLPAAVARALLAEFADLLSDHGCAGGSDLYAALDDLGHEGNHWRRNVELSRERKWILAQISAGERLPEVRARLRELNQIANDIHDHNLRANVVNVQAWLDSLMGRPERTYEALLELYEKRIKKLDNHRAPHLGPLDSSTPWGAADLLRNFAVSATAAQRDADAVERSIRVANRICAASGARPMCPTPTYWEAVSRRLRMPDLVPSKHARRAAPRALLSAVTMAAGQTLGLGRRREKGTTSIVLP